MYLFRSGATTFTVPEIPSSASLLTTNPPELRWVKAEPPRTRLLLESGVQVTKRGGIGALSPNRRLNESVLLLLSI